MVDLDAYKQCIQEIRQYASEHDVSQADTTKVFEQCFQLIERKHCKRTCNLITIFKYFIITLSIPICIAIGLYNYPSLNNILMRNLQNSIYPGLKALRKVAVPIIEKYPMLSELYDEWCLVENPYFYVSEMDCLPCSVVHSVPDLTHYNITKTFNIGIPYTKMEKNINVNMNDLVEMYRHNYDVFEKDAIRVSSNNASYRTIHDVMEKRIDVYPSESLTTHISWRINRMTPGRVIRKLFPKFAGTPDWWGPSIEKFVFIDELKSPSYSLPNPECSNVVVRCTEGARLIKMIPSLECLQTCRSSTILLSKGQSLWYNWWYWRPVSIPISNTTTVSISYLASFC